MKQTLANLKIFSKKYFTAKQTEPMSQYFSNITIQDDIEVMEGARQKSGIYTLLYDKMQQPLGLAVGVEG